MQLQRPARLELLPTSPTQIMTALLIAAILLLILTAFALGVMVGACLATSDEVKHLKQPDDP